MKEVLLLVSTLFSLCSTSTILDTSGVLLSRKARTLIFEEGLNWVQMVIGVGLPLEVQGNSITMGVSVKSYYEVPNNSTTFTRPTLDIERKKRSVSRWDLYSAIQTFTQGFGHKDGRSCLLHAICESASVPFDDNSGLLGEILHLLLSPSSTEELVESHFDQEYYAAEKLGKQTSNCQVLFPCGSNFMARFTKVFM